MMRLCKANRITIGFFLFKNNLYQLFFKICRYFEVMSCVK